MSQPDEELPSHDAAERSARQDQPIQTPDTRQQKADSIEGIRSDIQYLCASWQQSSKEAIVDSDRSRRKFRIYRENGDVVTYDFGMSTPIISAIPRTFNVRELMEQEGIPLRTVSTTLRRWAQSGSDIDCVAIAYAGGAFRLGIRLATPYCLEQIREVYLSFSAVDPDLKKKNFVPELSIVGNDTTQTIFTRVDSVIVYQRDDAA